MIGSLRTRLIPSLVLAAGIGALLTPPSSRADPDCPFSFDGDGKSCVSFPDIKMPPASGRPVEPSTGTANTPPSPPPSEPRQEEKPQEKPKADSGSKKKFVRHQ